jgi:acetolactate synthase I/III small subunit
VKHCLTVLVENRPAVLARVAGQVARRNVNIESFTARFLASDRAAITIGIDTDDHTAERLAKGIARLINVIDVSRLDGGCPDEPTATPQDPSPHARVKGEPCRVTR